MMMSISNTPSLLPGVCSARLVHLRTVLTVVPPSPSPSPSPTSSPLLSITCSCFSTHTHHHHPKRDRLRLFHAFSVAVPIPRISNSLLLCCNSNAGLTEIDETQFPDAVLRSDVPVLVEFVASWCGPCRLVAPAIQSIAREYEGRLKVVKIDHDANPRLIEKYKVYGLPALIIFKNGEEVAESRREGAISKDKLKDYIDNFLQTNSSVA